MVLNVIALLIGTAGAATGIFGDTWRGEARGLRKITRIGWLSLVCILLLLFVGTYREIRGEFDRRVRKEYEKSLEAQLEREKRANQVIELQLRAIVAESLQQTLNVKSDVHWLRKNRKTTPAADLEFEEATTEDFIAAEKNLLWIKTDSQAYKTYCSYRTLKKSVYHAALETQWHNIPAREAILKVGPQWVGEYANKVGLEPFNIETGEMEFRSDE